MTLQAAAPLCAALAMALLWTPAAGAATCITGTCHQAVVSAKFLHGPVAAEEAGAEGCVSCHVPAGPACTTARGGKYRFKTKEERLCLLCHDRGTGSQHTRARGNCLSCHSPHGSDLSGTLMRAG